MEQIVKNSLNQSISYAQYSNLVNSLAEQNSSTGLEITEELVNYTKLNAQRMKRWDKTLKVSEHATEQIKKWNQKIIWLVITESWCGDAAHVIPVIHKVATLNTNISLKFVLRDENERLINSFLTNGNKAIPKLIMLDHATKKVLNTYGPRPSTLTALVTDYKEKHGKLSPDFKEDLQR